MTVIERRPFSLGKGEWAYIDFTRRLMARLERGGGAAICELGGGARPALDLEFLDQHGLRCLVVDVSEMELEKAPAGYDTLIGDVSSGDFVLGEHAGRYDVVFSRVLAEHVRDARQFHENARRLLRPGGIAMHFFPTLWWPPFVANRILPERAAEWILLRVEPWRVSSGKSGKFPAYYHWCFGPTRRQLARLASTGFAVEECVAYFGESSHAAGRLLKRLNSSWEELLVRHPNYHLTSYAAYTLRAV